MKIKAFSGSADEVARTINNTKDFSGFTEIVSVTIGTVPPPLTAASMIYHGEFLVIITSK